MEKSLWQTETEIEKDYNRSSTIKVLNMFKIRKADVSNDIHDIHKIIQQANKTVANDLHLTIDNAPTSPAFIEIEKIKESIKSGVEYYIGQINNTAVGCVAIEKDKNDNNNYYIERLSVLPEHRHNSYGEKLLDHAICEIETKNGKSSGVAIINENKILKDWYLKYGFKEVGLKKFNHLPFTVCFMSKSI